MQADNDGFNYPSLVRENCTQCGACYKQCPQCDKNEKKIGKFIQAFAAYNLDEEQRLKSTSGGVFSLIAREIIYRGGVVFGAEFSERWDVQHSFAEDMDGVGRFYGSKYVQSDVRCSYKDAEDFLKDGRWVLFSGTPCQIAGLKSYLKKDYSTLITVDLVCHGVPSPKLWQEFLHDEKNIHYREIVNIWFRSKVNGWKNASLQVNYKRSFNEIERKIFKFGEDSYTKLFDRGISLRPSCYVCQYRRVEHPADITLGDCWHYEYLCPGMFDDKGLSIIMTQTGKGREVFSQISSNIRYEELDIEKIRQYTEVEASFFVESEGVLEYRRLSRIFPISITSKIASRNAIINRLIKRIWKRRK